MRAVYPGSAKSKDCEGGKEFSAYHARQEQGEEDDTEVYVNISIQAITRRLQRKKTAMDETLTKLIENITGISKSSRSWLQGR